MGPPLRGGGPYPDQRRVMRPLRQLCRPPSNMPTSPWIWAQPTSQPAWQCSATVDGQRPSGAYPEANQSNPPCATGRQWGENHLLLMALLSDIIQPEVIR